MYNQNGNGNGNQQVITLLDTYSSVHTAEYAANTHQTNPYQGGTD